MDIVEVDLDSELSEETAIALGNFDGIHLGHQALLEETVAMSNRLNIPSSVLIFKNHTANLIRGTSQELLTSQAQKYRLLDELGIDLVYEMDFNETIMHLSPEAFVDQFLNAHLHVRGVVVGYDYRFGYRAGGDIELLKALCRKADLELLVKEAVQLGGEAISSTRIRKAVKEGRPDLAARLLGRPFSIQGRVVKGKQLGRTIGIPTANLLFNTHYVAPKFGVYLARVRIGNDRYYAATNIGTNPTFNEERIKVESYLYDFQRESLYGKTIEVELLRFIRPELTFDGVESLKERMDADLRHIEQLIQSL